MTRRECVLRLLVAVTIIPLSALPPGCSRDCSRPDGHDLPQPFLPRTSAENLLHNFRMAYEHRDAVEIDSLLSADFVFYFSEWDQGRPEIPESWSRDMELEAHASMFDEDYVVTIQLDFVHDVPAPDSALTTEQDTVWTANVSDFDLELFGTPRSHPGGGPQLYKVDDGEVRFWFRRTAVTDPSSGEMIWRIVAARESTYCWPLRGKQPHPAESTSWGVVKALFE